MGLSERRVPVAKRDELKVYYGNGLNQELDKALEKTLERFGYHRWASGMDANGVRNIAFDRR